MENTPNMTQNNPADGGTGAPPLTEQAKNLATEVGHQARQKAGDLMDQAREQVHTQLNTRKDALVGSVDTLAQVLHQSSQSLQEQNQALVGQFIDRGADVVEGIARYFREHEVQDLVSEVEGFARREPLLFLGGAFTLGLMAARFLKSGAPTGGQGGGTGNGTSAGVDRSDFRYGPSHVTNATVGLGASGGQETGGPVETAGGSLWSGNGSDDDPRGRQIITGGETLSALPEDTEETNDRLTTTGMTGE